MTKCCSKLILTIHKVHNKLYSKPSHYNMKYKMLNSLVHYILKLMKNNKIKDLYKMMTYVFAKKSQLLKLTIPLSS